MRTTIGLISFVALSAATTAVSAKNLFGSDTLKKVTEDVITACNTKSGGATAGLVYLGTGSGNGQGALINDAQQVAPMSRMINASCTANSEGLVLALDGLSIVAASAVVTACSPGAEDCDKATDADSGIVYQSQTIPGTAYTLGGGVLGAGNEWKDALRLVYAGMDNNAGSSIGSRNCNSDVRKALVNTWGNLFENTCAAGTCTQLQHAFRRDDESGTSDAFAGLIGVTSINFASNVSPFCNSLQNDTNVITAQSCLKDADCIDFECNEAAGKCKMPIVKPNYVEFQDNDPVRRTCIGSGDINVITGAIPNAPTEQVCGPRGDLGLVLVINPPPPETGLTTAQVYPSQNCSFGKFLFGSAASQPTIGFTPQFNRCPNGDITRFGGQCLYPRTAGGDPSCINGKNNLPSVADSANTAGTTDGRVYNLYLHVGGTGPTAPNLLTIERPDPATWLASGGRVNAQLIGSFYRIHTTRTALAAPSTTGTCGSFDNATQQIGCLVAANPCSIGYAGNEAADVAGADALRVNALEPTDTCVRKFIQGGSVSGGTVYPLSRKLFLNSLDGFENLAAQSAASPNSEYEMAKCFADNSLIHSIIKDRGFVTIGDVTNKLCNADSDCSSNDCNEATGKCVPGGTVTQGGVYCESCQSPGTSASCANNNTNGTVGIPTTIEATRTDIP